MFAHHLAQPPQQEAQADIGRSGEVELVTQSRREDKIIHVCSYREEHRGEKEKCFRTQCIVLLC